MSVRKKDIQSDPDLLSQSPWFTTEELLEYLGISNSELRQQSQFLKKGTHYRNEDPKNPNSRILWRVDLIDELLCMPIPPLEREAMHNAINNKITCQQ